MLDFSDAKKQRADGASIPDGTVVKLVAKIRAGGVHGEDDIDAGLLKQSKSSDAQMLDFEYVVTWPQRLAGEKFWQLMTVRGGKVDENGASKAWNITKSQLRAMIDSALGLHPDDDSAASNAKRTMRGFSDFNGIEFFARVGVELGADNGNGGVYPDKNTLSRVITPDDSEWQAVQRGEEPPPKPSRAASSTRAAATQRPPAASWATPMAAPPPSWSLAPAPTANGAAGPPVTPAPAAAPTPASGPAWIRG